MPNCKRKIVRPQDFSKNMDALLRAAKEGRLYIEGPVNYIPSRTEIIREVHSYVNRIQSFTTRKWQPAIDEVWDVILSQDEFLSMLMPGPKTRIFRTFNKYGVMRIIGVLRSFSVYDERYNDSFLCQALENTKEDNAYRSYIGAGFEKRSQLGLMRQILSEIQL